MVEQPTIYGRSGVAVTIGVSSAVYAATFFFGALLHLGIEVPVGFAVLREPMIVPATIVEGLCAVALVGVMVVTLVAVLALLLSPPGRTALRRNTSPAVIQSP